MGESTEIKSEDNNSSIKSRLISMLVLAFSFSVAESVLIALVVGQVLFVLFAKEQNESLKQLAKQVVGYMHEALLFLSFNSDERPFPYKGWDEQTNQSIMSNK